MTDKRRPPLTLIERAANVYDFTTVLRGGAAPATRPQLVPDPLPVEPAPHAPEPVALPPEARAPASRPSRAVHRLDHAALRRDGYLDPLGAPTALSEEFRIVKRQLLTRAFAPDASAKDRIILVNSAHPGDGKSWTALNLALSLSAERDIEVLLVDGDFAKPALCQRVGVAVAPGLMDALADPSLTVEDCVVPTDIGSLCLLPAGRAVHDDAEVLASDHARAVLSGLTEGHPRRIVLIDSAPALAAAAASELARHVGMVLLVVRADRTSDAALRDAVQLLSACPTIQAVLNGVKFSSSGRLFGAYHGGRI